MAKKAAALAGPDTLSKLPDELLLVIISLLPMKDAVRSSVLSKRWRYLYASRSDLDFSFIHGSVPIDVMDVVDRVFLYRKSCPIQKFRFWCSKFGVLILVALKDDNGVERLLSNCPALEELECCIRDSECRLIVSSPTLKHLRVIDKRDAPYGVLKSFEISINAPNVVRLSYFVFDVNSHQLINAKSLTHASVSFFHDRGNFDNWILAATDLIRGISGVRTLNIAAHILEYCLGLNIPLPVFHNTTYLRISDGALDSFSDLLYVLTFFESLESLSLEEPPSKFDLDDGYELEESRASCLSFRLKEISFSGFKGEESEMKMVEYFLENAKVLEVLETDIYEGGCDDELDITKKLLVFPRASDKCKVVVSSHRVDEEDYE